MNLRSNFSNLLFITSILPFHDSTFNIFKPLQPANQTIWTRGSSLRRFPVFLASGNCMATNGVAVASVYKTFEQRNVFFHEKEVLASSKRDNWTTFESQKEKTVLSHVALSKLPKLAKGISECNLHRKLHPWKLTFSIGKCPHFPIGNRHLRVPRTLMGSFWPGCNSGNLPSSAFGGEKKNSAGKGLFVSCLGAL